MPGARVHQRALLGLVGRDHDRREGLAELALQHVPGGLHRPARRQARLEIGAQREAHERRVWQRLATVPGDVAEEDRDATVLEREHVIEVSARTGACRRTVGRRGGHRADSSRQHRQQRGLQQTHVLEQLLALALQSPRARRRQTRAQPHRRRERQQQADEHPHGHRHHRHDLRDRSRQRRGARGRAALRGSADGCGA